MGCTIDIAALIKDYREREKPLSDNQISQQLIDAVEISSLLLGTNPRIIFTLCPGAMR